MIRRIVAFLTIIAFICATFNIACAVPPNQGKVAAMDKGQKAPFKGVLLNPAAYAQIRAQSVTLTDFCKLDTRTALAQQKALFDMRIAILNSQLNAESSRRVEIIAIKDTNIAYLEKQLLHNSQPAYNEAWFAGGIIIGALTTIGIGFAIADIQR